LLVLPLLLTGTDYGMGNCFLACRAERVERISKCQGRWYDEGEMFG
jgi:hypothetical protein